MAQANLKLSEEKKLKWLEFVDRDDTVANNLSHLIRLSVEAYMAEDSDQTETPSGPDSETVGEILNAIVSVDNKVTDLQERMGAVERETSANTQYDLQRVLFAILPTGRPGDAAENGAGASDLASQIGADVDDVRETLNDMAEKSTAVWSAEDDDGRTKYVGVGN